MNSSTIQIQLKLYLKCIFFFCRLFSEITYAFKPDAIVVQCGADCLTNDPLGGFNLTPLSIANCLKKVVSKSLPTLILGGGGYNKVGIYQVSQLLSASQKIFRKNSVNTTFLKGYIL